MMRSLPASLFLWMRGVNLYGVMAKPCPWEPLWTPLRDNSAGFVNTQEEALRVKSLFEVHTSLKFNIQNCINKKRDLKFNDNDTINDNGSANEADGLQQRIRFADINDSVVQSDGVPFVSSFKRTYSCMFGRDKHAFNKKQKEQEKEKELKEDHPLPLKRRYRMMQPSRKKGCPALIQMKEVVRFPDFKIPLDDTLWKKKSVSLKIREALSAGEKLETERRIYIKLPSTTDHEGHDLGKMTGVVKPIDKRLSSKLTELVGHGVSGVQEMKRHLGIFVETILYPDPDVRPKVTDTTFYPSDGVIASRMYAAKSKMPSNIEIKARLHDPDQLRALAKQLADEQQTDIMEQVDTFFNCERGRLKLREIVNHPTRPAKLIAYVRPDQDGPKHSKFSITEVEDADSLKRTLGMALGVRGVVKKTRTLMMIGQTRLHIDEVEGLGNFMELEVCLETNQTQEEGTEIAHSLMKQLSIDPSDLISGAYMDLLES